MTERVQLELRPSHLAFLGTWVLAAVLVVLAAAIFQSQLPLSSALGWLTSAVALVLTVRALLIVAVGARWTMTHTTLMQRLGILSRNTSEVELVDVRNVQVRQSLIDRILGLGSVLVSTAGQSGIEITIAGIRDPHGIADRIRAERQAAGPRE